MPYCTQKVALLLELSHDSHRSGVIGLEEDRVEDLPSTRQVITSSLVDSPIGASSQWFSFDELDCSVAKVSMVLLCHFV